MVSQGQPFQRRIFIYGQFVDSKERSTSGRAARILSGDRLPSIALEILREFSALELIGKIHVMGRDRNWLPVTELGVTQFDWYKKYQEASRRKQEFYFEADGPESLDLWRVLYIRQESDQFGSYMAVALRHDVTGKLSDMR